MFSVCLAVLIETTVKSNLGRTKKPEPGTTRKWSDKRAGRISRHGLINQPPH